MSSIMTTRRQSSCATYSQGNNSLVISPPSNGCLNDQPTTFTAESLPANTEFTLNSPNTLHATENQPSVNGRPGSRYPLYRILTVVNIIAFAVSKFIVSFYGTCFTPGLLDLITAILALMSVSPSDS
ncbi:hypothetical protein OG21DRAFT_1206762 [Imleria badia]|nr:hypothetical protein OG21DRAFT_1206762 [Imleria badia]